MQNRYFFSNVSGSCRPFSKCIGQFGLQMNIANDMAFYSQKKSNAFKYFKCFQVNSNILLSNTLISVTILSFKGLACFVLKTGLMILLCLFLCLGTCLCVLHSNREFWVVKISVLTAKCFYYIFR